MAALQSDMAAGGASNSSEDVQDFLRRIQQMRDSGSRNDPSKPMKSEEEFLKAKQDRQARRLERARSISPQKQSPYTTASQGASPSLRSSVASQPRSPHLQNKPILNPPASSPIPEVIEEYREPQQVPTPVRDDQPTSSPQGSPTRRDPFAWQKRPEPGIVRMGSMRRPASLVGATPSPSSSPKVDRVSQLSESARKDDVAQMLASKSPDWFKQDETRRTQHSAAYMKSSSRDESAGSAAASRTPLHGMSQSSPRDQPSSGSIRDRLALSSGPSSQQSSLGRSIGSTPDRSYSSTRQVHPRGALPFRPPLVEQLNSDGPGDDLTRSTTLPSMAPPESNTPLSLHHRSRSTSPTKGLGGFVQSAMLKREGSVNKRWSAQAAPGLSRGNSIASRNVGLASVYEGPKLSSRPTSGSVTKDAVPIPDLRPPSRHDLDPTREVELDNTLPTHKNATQPPRALPEPPTKPTKPIDLPSALSTSAYTSTQPSQPSKPPNTSLPSEPTKTADQRRWSPTKSSWLESALTKQPASVKSPPPVFSPQQPKWMIDRDKAKAEGGGAGIRSPSPHKEVQVKGGLMKAPTIAPAGVPMAAVTSPPIPVAKPKIESKALVDEKAKGVVGGKEGEKSEEKSDVKSVTSRNTSTASSSSTKPISPRSPNPITSKSKPSPTTTKPTPKSPPALNTTPKSPPSKPANPSGTTDAPRSRTLSKPTLPPAKPPTSSSTDPPPFLAARSNLRSAKTKNYVAPDTLKDNITRGKAELAKTDGPRKYVKVDEFKESILEKKDSMKKDREVGNRVGDRVERAEKPEEKLVEGLAAKQRLNSTGSAGGAAKGVEGAAKGTDGASEPPTLAKRRGPVALGDLLMGRVTAFGRTPPATPPAKTSPVKLPSTSTTPAPFAVSSLSPSTWGRPVSKHSEAASSPGREVRPGVFSVFSEEETRPPSSRSQNADVKSGKGEERVEGVKLEHATKSRAKGPRRRPPGGV